MKKIGIIILFLATLLTSCVNKIGNKNTSNNHSDKIFQYSTKNGLLANNYTGNLSITGIKSNGDFGLGTFNMVDGEMVILNGNVYQVLTSGKINNITSGKTSPFVVTKFFKADTTISFPADISLDSAKTLLEPLIKNQTVPFAIKLVGKFKTLKSRSIDKVPNESVTLAEIVAKQTEFDFKNVEGTIVGFWYPQYFDGVNFPGFHLHVLLNDLSGGGHLLNCTFETVTAKIDFASGIDVAF